MTAPEIKVLPDPAAVAREAAERIVEISDAAIEARGRFSVALSGGATPKALYALLAASPYAGRLDWADFDVFFGDERCVPPDHKDSNYRMASETLLSKVPIPLDNVYRIRGEIDPEEAAKEYGLMLQDKFGDGGLDLMLLGMGDDGHTSSLFPRTTALHETKHRVVANFAESSSTGRNWRVTTTAPFINKSANILVLVTGANKAKRLAEVLQGPRDIERLPIQLVQPENGTMTWVIDTAAAEM